MQLLPLAACLDITALRLPLAPVQAVSCRAQAVSCRAQGPGLPLSAAQAVSCRAQGPAEHLGSWARCRPR
eukprot:8135068-Lingulodinium_polyedra.AAC.1